MKLAHDLCELAAECEMAHALALKAVAKEKLKHLTDRNFLRSKMIWLHGLSMTRAALDCLNLAHLIDEACATDLDASVECCLEYERKAVRAARRKNEDEARDYIDARDFLLTKMTWQHGAFKICDFFRSIGHDPIDRKELIRIIREPSLTAFDRMAAKVDMAEQFATTCGVATEERDEELLQLIEQIKKL